MLPIPVVNSSFSTSQYVHSYNFDGFIADLPQPEKVSKSKQFFSQLTRLAEAGKLARVVIDEAHCVSQLDTISGMALSDVRVNSTTLINT